MAHLNIFTYEQSKVGPLGYSEKENNATRALLNTFKINFDYFKFVLNELIEFKINTNVKDVNFLFQVNPKFQRITRHRDKKLFLFIDSKFHDDNHTNIEKELLPQKEITDETKNRPDGLIYSSDESFAILIEAKFGSKRSSEQIKRYKTEFFENKCDYMLITWENIYFRTIEYLDNFKSNLLSNNIIKEDNYENYINKYSEYFIVEQFKQYMEDMKMNGFNGIDFFQTGENSEWDIETARQILKLLRNEYPAFDNDFVPGKRPLTGHAWDTIYLKRQGKINENHEEEKPNGHHYSIGLSEKGFDIYFTARPHCISAIVKSDTNYENFYNFIKILSIDLDYYLEVFDYHKLKNKRRDPEKGHVQKGLDYSTFNLSIQLNKVVPQKGSYDYIKNLLTLAKDSGVKQLCVSKIYLFNDEFYQKGAIHDMSNKEICLTEIKKTLIELKPIFEFFLDLADNKK